MGKQTPAVGIIFDVTLWQHKLLKSDSFDFFDENQ